ncbi:MAG: putative lipid II flippase FtsW [Ilumatobacteraceae bacterium]|jgi:cell division protein FtsW|nr:putative lipid II flippase FtsW [Acidimicrobiaceae bacterium]MBP6489257.1 putative lipid II flippase FtsW [Ilumatobacteraceae bacterium]MBP7890232.1 putative lipid II flippase FtsW [Ilumatobacteraceae bacterium]MBP8210709.1 putative lipid II flippase FtsW [Ilumatobacteraceae bacterium]MBP9051852.1 putative lipid II flippase FtsW [Ilumatobacteraceae bacterium]
MTSSSTLIGDRRRAALARSDAMRRHPTRRDVARPASPPPTAFYVIAVVVTVFTMLGLVMVLSATSISQFHKGNSPWRLFNRQLLWAVLGVIGLWFAMRVPTRRWRRLVNPALAASCGLMLLPFVPGIGDRVNDASAWVAIGPINFQPSEFLKLAVLLASANLLAKRHDEMHDLGRTLGPVLAIAFVGAALCMLQSDLGSAIVLAAIVVAVAFIAGAPLLPMTAAGTMGAVGALAFVVSSPRREARFTAFMDIAAHKDHLSYQTYQAMIAMAQGGITGSGVGRGENKLGEFLPLAHSDFIFAVVAEELGMIGVVAVLGGFMVLAYAGVQVAMATHDRFHALLAGGIVSWLVVQTIINVGGVTGLMPVTGLTLPFFSAGGSSLFVTLTATGLLLNVARNVR